MSEDDTIFALSSGHGKSGVAVIRLSGPGCASALASLTGRPLPAARVAARRLFADPESGELIDDGLALFFPGPRSFTGEDVVELHIHGGQATVSAMLETLRHREGLRPAEAGEFTRRAFNNDRMDLTAVEGLQDLIDAETALQRRQALRQASGALSETYETWAEALTRILAHWEALIDFPDEDLPEEIHKRNEIQISRLRDDISQHLVSGRRAERLRAGVAIAILGPPNVGKSSILNRLAGRSAAIVSDRAGTTRDVLSVQMDLDGLPVTLYDTAGLRETADEIEAEGTRRALRQADEADIILLVSAEGACEEITQSAGQIVLKLANKSDLGGEARGSTADLSVSAATGEGFDNLLESLHTAAGTIAGLSEGPVMTRARHGEALREALEALQRTGRQADPVLAAEDLRSAVRAIGRITGTVDVDDLLDVIFRDFCIGK